jgi:hypothetical protein
VILIEERHRSHFSDCTRMKIYGGVAVDPPLDRRPGRFRVPPASTGSRRVPSSARAASRSPRQLGPRQLEPRQLEHGLPLDATHLAGNLGPARDRRSLGGTAGQEPSIAERTARRRCNLTDHLGRRVEPQLADTGTTATSQWMRQLPFGRDPRRRPTSATGRL